MSFFPFSPFSEHFQSTTYANIPFIHFFLPQLSLFHFFSLIPHPPLIQKGGHTLHACSFSYWDTPTSGPKGGNMCLKCPPPPPPPTRSTYGYGRNIIQCMYTWLFHSRKVGTIWNHFLPNLLAMHGYRSRRKSHITILLPSTGSNPLPYTLYRVCA